MSMTFADRTILLGVTGGIAAYKSADLCRQLVRNGAAVQVLMSESACQFITPLTMQTLSGRPVHTRMFDPDRPPLSHIDLSAQADLFLVAPATADYLARCATGRAEDLISAVTLAFPGQVIVAPAMNTHMWENPATRRNLRILQEEHNFTVVQPGVGELACGQTGAGRMAELEAILATVMAALADDFRGLRVLVTAGPTVEDLDPVRCLTNRSSGTTGYAIARQAALRGAEVTLVSGPTALDAPPGTRRISVRSAIDMEKAVRESMPQTDCIIMAAAVADYRPEHRSATKIKKAPGEPLTLWLVPNPDILATLGDERGTAKRPLLVGFALETENLLEQATRKRAAKNADLLVANLASDALEGPTTRAMILDVNGPVLETSRISKDQLANLLLDECRRRLP